MAEIEDLDEARANLEAAVKRWQRAKAQHVDPDDGYDDEQLALIQTDDPIVQGWVLISCYTSIELEREDATGYSYECADGQPAAFSRGLSLAGIDRWGNH